MLEDDEDDEHLEDAIEAHAHSDQLPGVLGEAGTLLQDVMQGGQLEDLEQSLYLADSCKPGHPGK